MKSLSSIRLGTFDNGAQELRDVDTGSAHHLWYEGCACHSRDSVDLQEVKSVFRQDVVHSYHTFASKQRVYCAGGVLYELFLLLRYPGRAYFVAMSVVFGVVVKVVVVCNYFY